MEKGGKITKHLETFNMFIAQLVSIGLKMDEEERCHIFLWFFPNSWDLLWILGVLMLS